MPTRLPALLVILDGVGIAPPSNTNAVTSADAPFLHQLFSGSIWPYRTLSASGRAVGLPDGQMGNSEVGHLNIGAGRVVNQELTRIDLAIEDGTLCTNGIFVETMLHCASQDRCLHLIGLLSDGGVHSMNTHIQALAAMAAASGVKRLALHALLDGRDVTPDSGIDYVQQIEQFLQHLEAEHPGLDAKIATIGGRYYGMDRDNRWERVEPAWKAMVTPDAEDVRLEPEAKASELVKESYANQVLDEFMLPVAISTTGIQDDDAIIFFNFRPDRARQMTRALIDPDFDGFDRPRIPRVKYVCMTEYDIEFEALGARVAFAKETLDFVLADYLSQLGLRQLHIAETEKYAHVTFFLNGGIEEAKPGEQRILIPSPKVATYDLQPEMSANEVTEALIHAIKTDAADVFIVNYANGDMVGHTGIQSAAEQAITAVDRCLQQVIDTVLEAGGVAIVTADHGNAEEMVDEEGNTWTAHSMSPVPLTIIGDKTIALDLEADGRLSDIAPTLLDLMGLKIPEEFTGKSLIIR
ncbi:MAG: 2,3-bisphosphoglycerate-independent phosphoglycerate mutase [Coriobacteriia bacterium]|nr:2,3-bisphosphoglycerate-independent phosphoglycerate mutase [Coriobacteriia bacterium]